MIYLYKRYYNKGPEKEFKEIRYMISDNFVKMLINYLNLFHSLGLVEVEKNRHG